MEKDHTESDILKESEELMKKIDDSKKGFTETIHSFLKGTFFISYSENSTLYRKEKAHLERLYFRQSKIITPPMSSR
jgi:hypothetical protein